VLPEGASLFADLVCGRREPTALKRMLDAVRQYSSMPSPFSWHMPDARHLAISRGRADSTGLDAGG